MVEVSSVKKGSWFSAQIHRKSLRKYAVKLSDRTITNTEVIDYIEKGGSIDVLKNYNNVRDYFNSAPRYSVLVTFIKPRYEHHGIPADNRLELLDIFLKAGANPNFIFEDSGFYNNGYLAPILLAAAADDLPALALLVQYNADLELREGTYIGDVGPTLALANKAETLDWLLAQGADINFVDDEGRTLLHLAIDGAVSLEKIQWLLDNGLSMNVKDKYGDTAIIKSEKIIESARANIDRYRNDPDVDANTLQKAIQAEEATIVRLEKVLSLFANESIKTEYIN